MSAATEQLLTPQNCVFVFIDHQPQMSFGVTSIDRQLLKNNVVAMAKTAKLFNIPTLLTAVETESFSGYIWPELMDVLQQDPIERTSMNSWEDKVFVDAVKKTGRKKLVIAALWTEACLIFPTLCALDEGYEVIMNIDASGGTSKEAHDAAIRRCEKHGAESISTVQLTLELQRDWSRKETYEGITNIVRDHFGAYGMGIEYAASMVHDYGQRAKYLHKVIQSQKKA
ncbi:MULTISPECIES: hydrolase [Legionella]|uniref:Hydrolase n=1 Tax=Legionella resiliens TaxID=2905958 RepID=A0ABS8X1C1_9GAMM|nr:MULTISPECIES: hydrolase [unclassified Legionella]MCE0722618.1 hydrolase [Legionella sp. 9fVS26]MCE3531772.1 hydrolase [Legionella sp. 8cVS16]QLZ67797.1 putative hydrolase YcaC [Legionella sp. PC1000]